MFTEFLARVQHEQAVLNSCVLENLVDFRITDVLGQGCNGIVLRAAVTKDGVPLDPDYRIALKVMFNLGETTAQMRNTYQNEYVMLSRCIPPHPNINVFLGLKLQIIPIPDSVLSLMPADAREMADRSVGGKVVRGKSLVLLFRCHSCTLETFIKRAHVNAAAGQWLSEDVFDSLACGILTGLIHLQRNGVCHFDMKPDNVLVDDSDPANPVAILCDFGCSRKLPSTWKMDRYKRCWYCALSSPCDPCEQPHISVPVLSCFVAWQPH